MNRPWSIPVASALSLACAFAGCTCGETKVAPGASPTGSTSASSLSSSSASMSAAAADTPAPARPVGPLPEAESPTIRTKDGFKLTASLWVGGEPTAPAVILVHRLAGTRAEWEPLVQRLFPAHSPMNVLAIDLRGHGGSLEKAGEARKQSWHGFKADDFARTARDVEAAAEFMSKRKGGPPTAFVFVGSDLGSTAMVVAVHDAKIKAAGLCLVSPGASLRGIDLYKPFGAALSLPNLIIAGKGDNVSNDPAISLRAMSKSSESMMFDSGAHSAEFLGVERPAVWDAIANWVDRRVGEAAAR